MGKLWGGFERLGGALGRLSGVFGKPLGGFGEAVGGFCGSCPKRQVAAVTAKRVQARHCWKCTSGDVKLRQDHHAPHSDGQAPQASAWAVKGAMHWHRSGRGSQCEATERTEVAANWDNALDEDDADDLPLFWLPLVVIVGS